MRKNHLAAGLSAAVVASVGVLPLVASGDTENCASRGEYAAVDVGMSLPTVRGILDIDGTYYPGGETTFAYKFRSCWAPGEERVVVVFGNSSGLSVNKRIEDV